MCIYICNVIYIYIYIDIYIYTYMCMCIYMYILCVWCLAWHWWNVRFPTNSRTWQSGFASCKDFEPVMCGWKELDYKIIEEEDRRGETTCDIKVVFVAASGKRLANGDSLVPPAFRTRSSRPTISISDIPSAVSREAWVPARLPSSEGGGTSLDPPNAEVEDVAIGDAEI